MINITTQVKESEWNEFLKRDRSANIYHTPKWKKILENSFGYEPYYLFAKDEYGQIEGLFPLIYLKSRITKNRLSSIPFAHVCGPVGNETAVNLLVLEGIKLFKKLKVTHFEIKSFVDFYGFKRQNAFSTYILDLSPNVEEVWKKMDKGSVRWAIKKSQKEGVSVDITKNIEDLKSFYELNCQTKKDIGVPCHPWNFFENLFKFLNNYVYLYVARYDNQIIGGGIMMHFKDTVIYGYGASNSKYLNLHPYNAIIWKSIEDACLKVYKYYDFGRTSYDNVGLINFKKRWGTVEKKLYYSYYPKNSESLTGNRENLKYKLGTKVIQDLPMPIYKTFSNLVFGSFG